MDLSKKKIWALLDDRQGNTNQTLGVAEALGFPFEKKNIEFNEFIRIPNIFINKTMLGFRSSSRPVLIPPWPDIVISTARRLGIVSSYIKSKNPSTFIAQIQWPGSPATHFDFIATPKHDNIPQGGNVFLTIGAPHRVHTDVLARDAEIWRPKITDLSSPRIAILVGGSAGSRKFTKQHAKNLAVLSSELANSLHGSLLVTTSRRTGREASEMLEDFLNAPYYFYDWDDSASESSNPFFGFLALADAIIVTGDSISMCSEACATGKPVFIYAEEGFTSPKHRQFIGDLFTQNLARPLLAKGNEMFTPAGCLNDSLVIAEEIKRRLAAR